MEDLQVVNRLGQIVPLDYSAILRRIRDICVSHQLFDQSKHKNAATEMIFAKVVGSLVNMNVRTISTKEIDQITVEHAYKYGHTHYDGFRLASILFFDNFHKMWNLDGGLSFDGYINRTKALMNPRTGKSMMLLSEALQAKYDKKRALIDRIVDYNQDFQFPYEGCLLWESTYLQKHNKSLIESPQDSFTRQALVLFDSDDEIELAYKYLSSGRIVTATPTILRAGTNLNSMTSCNMMRVHDNIENIMDRAAVCGMISKGGGGIGLDFTPLRGSGALINTTNGVSQGPMGFSVIFEAVANTVDQGGQRPGAFAIYLQMWHLDVERLISARNEFTSGLRQRVTTLFTGLFVSSLFFERCASKGNWTLFCPSIASELIDLYDEEFRIRYEELEAKYANHTDGVKRIKAQDLYTYLLDNKTLTGMPYVLDKDLIYATHNQIHQVRRDGFCILPNLCTETIIACDPKRDEVTTCNLSTVAIPKFVIYDVTADHFDWPVPRKQRLFPVDGRLDDELLLPILFKKYHGDEFVVTMHRRFYPGRPGLGTSLDLFKLGLAAYQAVITINAIISRTHHQVEDTVVPSLRDRPIGLGQQGFGDMLTLLGYTFESPEAFELNSIVQSTIYYFGWLASVDMAREHGRPCEAFEGSALAAGKMHHDVLREYIETLPPSSSRDREFIIEACNDKHFVAPIEFLRDQIKQYGVYNILITSLQPTETNAKAWGNSEMCDPRKACHYQQKNQHRAIDVFNRYLLYALDVCNVSIESAVEYILNHRGSITGFSTDPQMCEFIDLFKTIYEIDPFLQIKFAARREPFIDMSQSTNMYLKNNSRQVLAKLHWAAYKYGLRTISYYARFLEAATAINEKESCLMCQ